MPSSSQPSNVPSAIAGMSAVLCRKKTHEQQMTRAPSIVVQSVTPHGFSSTHCFW